MSACRLFGKTVWIMSKDAGIQTLSLTTSWNERYHSPIAMTGDVHERARYSFNAIQSRSRLRL
ncbi:hypothetical protein DL345_08945 [Citrobacter koseri]|nr:hypothetical protein DL345_08945 [Citrobacter koseri]